jgi:hypothetical protein
MTREGEDLYFDDMLEIVIDILLREADGQNLEIFTNLFHNLFQMLLTTGDIEHALVLLRRLRRIMRSDGGLPEGLQDRLEDFFAHLGSPQTIDILGESLRQERGSTLDALPSLLGLFPPTAWGLPRSADSTSRPLPNRPPAASGSLSATWLMPWDLSAPPRRSPTWATFWATNIPVFARRPSAP